MSKERLEEIQKEVNYAYGRDGSISTKAVTMPIEHYEHLYEQAERVQELERVNKQLKNNLSVYKGYYKNTLKINEDVIEQNKRYREALEKLVNAPQDMSRGRYADYADRVAREALEDEK